MERRMKRTALAILVSVLTSSGVPAQQPPLLPEKDVAALANEISGETAKRNLEGIARFHRQRGSKGFHEAAELVAERLRAYGLSDVAILQFPADGKIFYGTQRSRPAWDVEAGEIEIIAPEGLGFRSCNSPGIIVDCKEGKYLARESFESQPVILAEDSESAVAIAELVDVGDGTKETDYGQKNVKGKIVLVSAQPGAVQDLAVGKYGAAGIVSYAQNQKTAWSGENLDAIRWGHMETFSSTRTFGFMVSLKTAKDLNSRLANGERIWVHAVVKAGQHAGIYEVVTARIPGSDAKLKEEEVAFSCHLDHQRPGANDNASGCSTILEVARTLQKLIGEGKLARPARTIRFVFPPEIEGTMALLTGRARVAEQTVQNDDATERETVLLAPQFPTKIKAVVHMDMVGGGTETKAVFHVTRGPMSLPSFVHDVAWAFAEWVNEESYQFAATGKAAYPLVSPEGGNEPLRAEYSAYTMGSDHDVYQDSSFGIPAIYMNDWPDRFIHTNLDTAANIDATKLKRVGFIGAASGYFLAGMTARDGDRLEYLFSEHTHFLTDQAKQHEASFPPKAQCIPLLAGVRYANERHRSLERFLNSKIKGIEANSDANKPYECHIEVSLDPVEGKDGLKMFRRKRDLQGPMVVFGYDYFEVEWLKRGHTTKPKLLEFQGLWGGGEEYAYEVLNSVASGRAVDEICAMVSAEYGPVPLELVVEYLKALEEIGVVEEVKLK